MKKNNFALEITHIGEKLVAVLLRNKQIQGKLKKIIADKKGGKCITLPDSINTEDNVPIVGQNDPMHRIDVLLTGKVENSKVNPVAIEVKLGTTIDTPGKYCKRYLSNRSNCERGNMIRKLMDDELHVCVDKVSVQIQKTWILLVLSSKIKGKLENPSSQLGEYNQKLWKEMCGKCIVVALEELLSDDLKEDFEAAVTTCITPTPPSKFYDMWIKPNPSGQ